MINTINVLLSNHSVSFCHYENDINEDEKWIDAKILKETFEYSKQNEIAVNVVFPLSSIPKELDDVLLNESFTSTCSYDFCNCSDINVVKIPEIHRIDFSQIKNGIFVVLIEKTQLFMISELFLKMNNHFKRLSLIFTDINEWNEQDIDNYNKELNENFEILLEIYKSVEKSLPEINIITDRWFLNKENSCNAGVSHYTVGPDGKLYLCPAFYFSGNENIGTLRNIDFKNEQLLRYDHAPICRSCDAYHCNRCVYLNKTMTNEYNTPSFQQCVISHREREISRKLLTELKLKNPLFNQIQTIPIIDYVDPLEKRIKRISRV